jgi:DNA-binding CsgD family transcriptional regulator
VTTGSGVPPALRLAADTVSAARGRVMQLRRVFDRSLIPMVIVDNDRRYLEVNAAARLVFRMSLHEMRRSRLDDFTDEEHLANIEDAWAEVMENGSANGHSLVTFKDQSKLWFSYAVLPNVLPAQHLIVFAPAGWPGDELEEMHPARQDGQADSLSPRQLDVLRLVAVGSNATQIATELSISEATVRTHVKHILDRLGAHNRAHAVALAMAGGLLGAEQPPGPA